jgi:luciferase family oxidoreductase group 1
LGDAVIRPGPVLSVLDLAPVGEGGTVTDALESSIELAVAAERLGYRRHWVAEHHNMPGIASSAPAVLIAHLAAATSTIRLGSGGVMLPNHAPLVIAEQFGTLEALHRGRIDLGLGRAPGTDPLTAYALRRGRNGQSEDDFAEQLAELVGFFDGDFPDDHPFGRITAVPGLGQRPAIWLLGSSDYSARLAARLGLPFSFAHHFASGGTEIAARIYREEFEASVHLAKPYLMLGVAALAADTAERATWLSGSTKLAVLRLRQGRPGRYPTPEEAAAFRFTPNEREAVKQFTASHIVGDPGTVRAGLEELAHRTAADELMITTMVHAPEDRIRSYELIAEAVGLEAPFGDSAGP